MHYSLIPVVALGAFYATLLARKLPGLRGLTERGVKPLACDVCMSFWTSSLLSLLVYAADCMLWDETGWFGLAVFVLAAAGSCLLLLSAYAWAAQHLGLEGDLKPEEYREPLP